jgi:hypothetical protein
LPNVEVTVVKSEVTGTCVTNRIGFVSATAARRTNFIAASWVHLPVAAVIGDTRGNDSPQRHRGHRERHGKVEP